MSLEYSRPGRPVHVPDHPATFPVEVLERAHRLLTFHGLPAGAERTILDPFAGTGGIHHLRAHGWDTHGLELEPEWAAAHPDTHVGNAMDLSGMSPPGGEWFAAIFTSPAYGNRMADTYDGRDGTERHTYRTALGRPLSRASSAAMQWGDDYRAFHRRAWAEATRVLITGGLMLINIKDHVRDGRRQYVTRWHAQALRDLGHQKLEHARIALPGIRHGTNAGARVGYETILCYRKLW